MRTRKLVIIDYPIRTTLTTYKTFKSDEERENWFHSTIKRKPEFDNSYHHWSDYVVELVKPLGPNTEYWVIGS